MSMPSKLKLLLALLIIQISLTLWYTSTINLAQFLPNDSTYWYHSILSSIPSNIKWTPASYLQHALAGSRPCQHASCYIVDILPDPYQPRLFLSMLGLPATDIPRHLRGNTTNVTFVDVRTNQTMVLGQSLDLVNDTHSYAVLVQFKNVYVMSTCEVLRHNGSSMNAFYESMTYACDIDYPIELREFETVKVDVMLAPLRLAASWGVGVDTSVYLNLNGADRPFYIDGGVGRTSGMFNSVSRPRHETKQFWKEQDSKNATTSSLKVSACLIGVDYVSPQHREIIQYYLSIGFEHIYLGVPQWPTSSIFNETWMMLNDFVEDGSLSIIVSEYARDFIEPEKFGRNFTYAPQGHKSSFVNTCILAVRAAGDDLVFVGDLDELIEYKYGNTTSISDAITMQLSTRNMTLSELCAMNLGALGGFYHLNETGYASPARIADKLAAVGDVPDSVSTYGKSILNVKRALRAGMHSVAYCEAPLVPGLESVTRFSYIDERSNFRPDVNEIRILHLRDSYKGRSQPWMIDLALKGNYTSYYVHDFSRIVHSKLVQRTQQKQ